MTVYGFDMNTSLDGVATSGEYGDRGDATSGWLQWTRSKDGGDTTQGLKADAAVTDPTSSGTVVSLLKGLLTFLRISAAGVGKAEDTAHVTGDTGVMTLAVRKDTAAASSDTTGDYEPLSTDSVGRLRVVAKRDTTDALSLAATTALATSIVVKASPGTLHSIVGYSTTAQFLQVHDASSLPADTAVPEMVFPIAANEAFNIPLPGHVCATGIVICNSTTGPTKTIGAADTWVTAYYE